jgi:hypothetical protein
LVVPKTQPNGQVLGSAIKLQYPRVQQPQTQHTRRVYFQKSSNTSALCSVEVLAQKFVCVYQGRLRKIAEGKENEPSRSRFLTIVDEPQQK